MILTYVIFEESVNLMEQTRLTFNIEKDIKQRIKQLALDKETTTTDLCVKWISDGLEKENGQRKLDI